jgi:hypothetical protein
MVTVPESRDTVTVRESRDMVTAPVSRDMVTVRESRDTVADAGPKARDMATAVDLATMAEAGPAAE